MIGSLGHGPDMGPNGTPIKSPVTAEPPGIGARRAALKLLDAVLRRGQPLEGALHNATQGLADRADRALAHAIAAAVLRHLTDLDGLIDGATQRPLPDDAKARLVLRMALAQHFVLNTPAHALIATALPLVDGGPRKLVHGVLGTLLRGGAVLPDPPALPPPVAQRWGAQWGDQAVMAAQVAFTGRSPIDLSLRDGDAEEWATRLGGQSLAPRHVRLPADSDVPSLAGFDDGAWWVQDLAASIPARLLGDGAGRAVIDACAAPGGKTMQLTAAGWHVTALDASSARVDRMADNLARTGLAAQTVVADMRAWEPEAPVDAVLLDAPCSATGIFRRHPDVLYRIGDRQVAELAALQADLLDRVVGWLKPGGRLVYSTCSLERAEGEAQVERLLASRDDIRLIVPDAVALPAAIAADTAGTVRTGPWTLTDAGGVDGFFIALLGRI